jgi:tetratricopeptide (TPR) repeat protein
VRTASSARKAYTRTTAPIMGDPTRETSATLPTASATEFVVTFTAILVAIAVLLGIDTWLARVDRAESTAHAANLYADGQQLLARRDPRGAIERFASAAAIERTNVVYQVGLAEALLADHRLSDAEGALNAALDRAEMDGAANRLMARVQLEQGRSEEATAYYHRAIYGRWRGDTLGERLQTRFELISLLSKEGWRQELLAELLPMQDAAPDSVELRRKLGHLFIEAGSPSRGIEIYRKLLQRSRDDGDAYAGMGEAALALGNFRTAQADLRIAARLLPGDTAVARRLALADSVLVLDPMQRGIGQAARQQRSHRVLALTLDVVSRCGARSNPPLRALADSARTLLEASSTPAREVDSDALLTSAADLWNVMPEACSRTSLPTIEALALIQARLGS